MSYSKDELYEMKNDLYRKLEEVSDMQKQINAISNRLDDDYDDDVAHIEKILSDSTYGSVTTEWLEDFLNSTKARRKANEDRENEGISQLECKYQELEDEMAAIASYTQIERDDDYCLDYFRKIDETYSYSRIVDEVGESNGLVGSGVSNPYWIVDDKYVLVIWGSDHENILKVVLCDQDKEIEDFYVKHKK